MDKTTLVFLLKLTKEKEAYNGNQAIDLKKANAKRIKECLGEFPTVNVIAEFDNQVSLHISDPEKINDEKELWEELLEHLKNCEFVESVSVYVNEDLSEKIAINLAGTVRTPWNECYHGHNQYTLIYHK